jgi:hypothetical protein
MSISKFIVTDDVIRQLGKIKFTTDRPPGAIPLMQLGLVNVCRKSTRHPATTQSIRPVDLINNQPPDPDSVISALSSA